MIKTIAATLVAVLLVFSVIGFAGSYKATQSLERYEKTERETIKTMKPLIDAADSTYRSSLQHLFQMSNNLDDDYYVAIKLNYPLLTSLTLIGLISAIVAAFLNLIAINRGWSNISLMLRTGLVTTIFTFIMANYCISVFGLQEKVDIANQGYGYYKKIRKNICQYAQTGGKDFYTTGDSLPVTEFMGIVYDRLRTMPEVNLSHDSNNLPHPIDVQDLIRKNGPRELEKEDN